MAFHIAGASFQGHDNSFDMCRSFAMLDHLQSELKTSMLAKNAPRTQVLRMALAAYKN